MQSAIKTPSLRHSASRLPFPSGIRTSIGIASSRTRTHSKARPLQRKHEAEHHGPAAAMRGHQVIVRAPSAEPTDLGEQAAKMRGRDEEASGGPNLQSLKEEEEGEGSASKSLDEKHDWTGWIFPGLIAYSVLCYLVERAADRALRRNSWVEYSWSLKICMLDSVNGI
jgi:hypothetical protein